MLNKFNLSILILVFLIPTIASAMVGAHPTLFNGEEVVLMRALSPDRYIIVD